MVRGGSIGSLQTRNKTTWQQNKRLIDAFGHLFIEQVLVSCCILQLTFIDCIYIDLYSLPVITVITVFFKDPVGCFFFACLSMWTSYLNQIDKPELFCLEDLERKDKTVACTRPPPGPDGSQQPMQVWPRVTFQQNKQGDNKKSVLLLEWQRNSILSFSLSNAMLAFNSAKPTISYSGLNFLLFKHFRGLLAVNNEHYKHQHKITQQSESGY